MTRRHGGASRARYFQIMHTLDEEIEDLNVDDNILLTEPIAGANEQLVSADNDTGTGTDTLPSPTTDEGSGASTSALPSPINGEGYNTSMCSVSDLSAAEINTMETETTEVETMVKDKVRSLIKDMTHHDH